MDEIVIRRLLTVPEFEQAVDLQKIYWGDDGEALVPMHMLHSLARHGGHVLGAFDGDKMIGVLIGFIGTDIDLDDIDARPAMANLLIMSKRMVVLPEYRGQQIGYKLKMAQRDVAMKQGIRLVTWTFDPLLATNAHLNIRKLGAISQRYALDYFGNTDQQNLGADRLVVDWWVTHQRVKERAKGKVSSLPLKQYFDANAILVNRADFSDADLPKPRAMFEVPFSTFALIEIPRNFRDIEAKDMTLADTWRDHIRDIFTKMMSAGYIVTDFLRDVYEGQDRTFYLLSHDSGQDYRQN